jgi:hypothetical protein
MRNLLALFALLVLAFLGCGYFLGWYKISTAPAPDGHRSVTIDLNTKKIGQDIHAGAEKVGDAFEKKDTTTVALPPAPGAPSSQNVEPPSWWSPNVPGVPVSTPTSRPGVFPPEPGRPQDAPSPAFRDR